MRRDIIGISLICILGLFLCGTEARAEKKRVFAVVPKFMNNPFFDFVRDGCRKAEKENPNVECLYIGPASPSEEEQVQVIQDLITRGVDGIAVSPANAPAIARVLKRAESSGIPVITFDSDLLPADKALRKTYIGTRNYDLGQALAKKMIELKPKGARYALLSGGPASTNLNERMQGVRDALQGLNWTEVSGTPLYCNDDAALAVQQMADLFTRNPDLEAFIPVGGWPQVPQRAYRATMNQKKQRIDKGELIIVSADTLPVQMEILKDGLGNALVGQRPLEMGYKSIQILNEIVDGKTVPDPIYTGLDVCTRENIATCLGQ